MTNIPPSKARKIWKDRNAKPGGIEDIFSDGEVVLHPRKSKVVQDSDNDDSDNDDPDSDSNGLSVTRSSKSIKTKKGFTPEPFSWTESDIPSTCPEIDCEDDVVANPSPLLLTLFRNRAEVIHREGIEADAVYFLNLKICVELKIALTIERRQRRAKKHGLVNVDFQLLANRVWDLKHVIDPLMSSPAARANTFIWTNLLDEFKAHEYSAARLNKGKDVPRDIVAAARPG